MENPTLESATSDLYNRIMSETEALLRKHMQSIGVNIDDLGAIEGVRDRYVRLEFPEDPLKMFTYLFDGKPILTAQIHLTALGASVKFLSIV